MAEVIQFPDKLVRDWSQVERGMTSGLERAGWPPAARAHMMSRMKDHHRALYAAFSGEGAEPGVLTVSLSPPSSPAALDAQQKTINQLSSSATRVVTEAFSRLLALEEKLYLAEHPDR